MLLSPRADVFNDTQRLLDDRFAASLVAPHIAPSSLASTLHRDTLANLKLSPRSQMLAASHLHLPYSALGGRTDYAYVLNLELQVASLSTQVSDGNGLVDRMQSEIAMMQSRMNALEDERNSLVGRLSDAHNALRAQYSERNLAAGEAARLQQILQLRCWEPLTAPAHMPASTVSGPVWARGPGLMEMHQLALVNPVHQCSCGAVFEDSAQYCKKCGAPRPHARCICGNTMTTDAEFCRKCGRPRDQVGSRFGMRSAVSP